MQEVQTTSAEIVKERKIITTLILLEPNNNCFAL